MSPQPASFALERFAVTPVTADTVLLELQGVLDGAPPRAVPQLLVEGAQRTRREHAPIEPLPAEPRLRAAFVVPGADIETATFSLVVGGLLLELPPPDATPGADRTVALARELNGARRGLAQARDLVAHAAEREAAHVAELVAVREAAATAEAERAAESEARLQAAATEHAGQVGELQASAAAVEGVLADVRGSAAQREAVAEEQRRELEADRDAALRTAETARAERDEFREATETAQAERDAAREEARRATDAAQAERVAREEQARIALLDGEGGGPRARAAARPLDVAEAPSEPDAPEEPQPATEPDASEKSQAAPEPVTAEEATVAVAAEAPSPALDALPEGDPSPDDDEAPPTTVVRRDPEPPEDTGPIPLRRASERRYTPAAARGTVPPGGLLTRNRSRPVKPSPPADAEPRLPASQAPRGLVVGVVALAALVVLIALLGYVL